MKKEVHLWTDGSSVNNGEEKGLGGYGFVLLYGNFEGLDLDSEEIHIEYEADATLKGYDACINTSNQREEVKAVIEGLKRIHNHNVHIKVFSDSAYLINCMNNEWYVGWRANGWRNSKKEPVANKDLWEELLAIIEDNFLDIEFVKIKGHKGIYYNELCDKLARQGLQLARMVKSEVLEGEHGLLTDKEKMTSYKYWTNKSIGECSDV